MVQFHLIKDETQACAISSITLRQQRKNMFKEFRTWILLERSMAGGVVALCMDVLLFTKASCVVFVSFVLLALHVRNCLDCLKVIKKKQMLFASSVLFLDVLWTSLSARLVSQLSRLLEGDQEKNRCYLQVVFYF